MSVADWPTGKPGDFPVGPCFMKFFGPPVENTRIYFIDNQFTQSADKLSIQRTGQDVRRVSPSERMTVMGDILFIHLPATAYQPLKSSYGVWGSAVSSPAGSGAELQRKSIVMHFSL